MDDFNDPLGVGVGQINANGPGVTPYEALPKWGFDESNPSNEESDEGVTTGAADESPFAFDSTVNSKLRIYTGDITSLSVDAIVHATCEDIVTSSTSERLFQSGGGELLKACEELEGCRTGEAKTTPGFNLTAKLVIHTVGPNFNERYKSAARSALFNSYRNCLQQLCDSEYRTIAFPVIGSPRGNHEFPEVEAAHLSLRTIRRFLEVYPDYVDGVVLVLGDRQLSVYSKALPLYFPRSKREEATSRSEIPKDIGDLKTGEPLQADRLVRIGAAPATEVVAPENERQHVEDYEGVKAISEIRNTSDNVRIMEIRSNMSAAVASDQQFATWLMRAKHEDFSQFERLRFLYRCGVDSEGRVVIVFIGSMMPDDRNNDKALAYFVQFMERLASKQYVLVYVNTNVDTDDMPPPDWWSTLLQVLEDKVEAMHRLYLVHASWFVRMKIRWFASGGGLSGKVEVVDQLAHLEATFPPGQVDLPAFVYQYEAEQNGTASPPVAGGADDRDL